MSKFRLSASCGKLKEQPAIQPSLSSMQAVGPRAPDGFVLLSAAWPWRAFVSKTPDSDSPACRELAVFLTVSGGGYRMA